METHNSVVDQETKTARHDTDHLVTVAVQSDRPAYKRGSDPKECDHNE